MTLKNKKTTNKEGEKKVSWTQTGEDAIYLYKLLHKQNNEVDFKEFLKTHQNWEEKYDLKNLRRNFNNCKKNLDNYYKGQCKFNIIFIRARNYI